MALEHYALVTDQDSSVVPATTIPRVWLGQQKSDVKSDVRASKKDSKLFLQVARNDARTDTNSVLAKSFGKSSTIRQ